jgi:hypothetical protein
MTTTRPAHDGCRIVAAILDAWRQPPPRCDHCGGPVVSGTFSAALGLCPECRGAYYGAEWKEARP